MIFEAIVSVIGVVIFGACVTRHGIVLPKIRFDDYHEGTKMRINSQYIISNDRNRLVSVIIPKQFKELSEEIFKSSKIIPILEITDSDYILKYTNSTSAYIPILLFDNNNNPSVVGLGFPNVVGLEF
jgi:hypothetical protein